MQQDKPTSTTVVPATLAQRIAQPSSMTRSRNVSSGKGAGHGSKKMVLQMLKSATSGAIDQQIGCVNPASVLANVMWICLAARKHQRKPLSMLNGLKATTDAELSHSVR